MIIYIGPDQVMPVGSALGALIGLILMFWNKLAFLVSRIVGRPLSKREMAGSAAPHGPDPRTGKPQQR